MEVAIITGLLAKRNVDVDTSHIENEYASIYLSANLKSKIKGILGAIRTPVPVQWIGSCLKESLISK